MSNTIKIKNHKILITTILTAIMLILMPMVVQAAVGDMQTTEKNGITITAKTTSRVVQKDSMIQFEVRSNDANYPILAFQYRTDHNGANKDTNPIEINAVDAQTDTYTVKMNENKTVATVSLKAGLALHEYTLRAGNSKGPSEWINLTYYGISGTNTSAYTGVPAFTVKPASGKSYASGGVVNVELTTKNSVYYYAYRLVKEGEKDQNGNLINENTKNNSDFFKASNGFKGHNNNASVYLPAGNNASKLNTSIQLPTLGASEKSATYYLCMFACDATGQKPNNECIKITIVKPPVITVKDINSPIIIDKANGESLDAIKTKLKNYVTISTSLGDKGEISIGAIYRENANGTLTTITSISQLTTGKYSVRYNGVDAGGISADELTANNAMYVIDKTDLNNLIKSCQDSNGRIQICSK